MLVLLANLQQATAEGGLQDRGDSGLREPFWNTIEARLVDAAVMDTPTPEDLPGSPLDRLTVALDEANGAADTDDGRSNGENR